MQKFSNPNLGIINYTTTRRACKEKIKNRRREIEIRSFLPNHGRKIKISVILSDSGFSGYRQRPLPSRERCR